MAEYEIVAKFLNGCAGAAHPQTFFEEAELENRVYDSYRLSFCRILSQEHRWKNNLESNIRS